MNDDIIALLAIAIALLAIAIAGAVLFRAARAKRRRRATRYYDAAQATLTKDGVTVRNPSAFPRPLPLEEPLRPAYSSRTTDADYSRHRGGDDD